MPDAVTSSLRPLDWGVLGLYLIILTISGIAFSRREQKDTADYFLGGRRMPVFAVALSIIASSLSVATFIGVPQIAYTGDLTYLLTNLGGLLSIGIVAAFFIPAFYRANVTSIYELLGQRLGDGAKTAASATFMIGRVFASGARIYIAAIPLSLLLFGDHGDAQPEWHLIVSCIALVVISVSYTLAGGIASVIWTEVVQTIVLLLAVGAAIWLLLYRIPLSVPQIVETLSTAGEGGTSKLLLVNTGTHVALPYTLWTSVFAFTLMGLASYGTDHDLAQRMLTCKNAIKGGQSAVLAIVMGIPIVAMFMVIGLLLFVYYKMPAVMGGAGPTYTPTDSRRVFLTFILREMPPGLSGLMLAGLLSVGISSLNSALNAMGATAIKDFYTRWKPNREPHHYVTAGRWAVVMWGVILAGFSCLCIFWQRSSNQNLIDFALAVMTFAYAGLLAVFLTALFTRRGNSHSAIAAICTGFAVIAILQPAVWKAISENGFAALTYVHPGFWVTWPLQHTLVNFELAWPWHLVIGTVLSLLVCVAGRRPEKTVD